MNGNYDFSILQNNPIANAASKVHVVTQPVFKTNPKTMVTAFLIGAAVIGAIWIYVELKKDKKNENSISGK